MRIPEELKSYTADVEACTDDAFNSAVGQMYKSSFTTWLDNQLDVFMNCIKTLNGQNIIMTSDVRYNREMGITIRMINAVCETDDEFDFCFDRLIARHRSNLEYESTHEPTYSIKKTKERKQSVKKQGTKKLKQMSILDEAESANVGKISLNKNMFNLRIKK